MTYSLLWNTPNRQIAVGCSHWTGIQIIHYPFEEGVLHMQGWAHPSRAKNILNLLELGVPPQEAIDRVMREDTFHADRQILILKFNGEYGCYQGKSLVPNTFMHTDSVCAVAGNMISDPSILQRLVIYLQQTVDTAPAEQDTELEWILLHQLTQLSYAADGCIDARGERSLFIRSFPHQQEVTKGSVNFTCDMVGGSPYAAMQACLEEHAARNNRLDISLIKGNEALDTVRADGSAAVVLLEREIARTHEIEEIAHDVGIDGSAEEVV